MNYEKIFGFFPKWITKFEIDDKVYGGSREAINDRRLLRLNEIFPIVGKKILELGPFEGGHTIMLRNLGAREVIAIEGRDENYVKCCIVKNIYDLKNCTFVLDDLRTDDLEKYGKFDCCICMGVLYHLVNPYDLLKKISNVSDRLFVWTHYSDDEYPKGEIKELKISFNGNPKTYRGKNEIEIVSDAQAGLQKESIWLFEKDLVEMVKDVGYKTCEIWERGSLYHYNAKSCVLYATK